MGHSVNLAAALATWAAQAGPDDLDAVQRRRVSDSIVDTIGVAAAAARRVELAPVLGLAAGSSGGAVRWGGTEACDAPTAALLNATAGHLLDFDDTHYLIHGHPSTVVLPAAFAAAEAAGAGGGRVLRGYVAGIGVMAAMARGLGPEHYSRGWHSTSTCGVFGAAVAAAVAMGLDAEQIAEALRISASSSLGIRANFGTILKPLHAGFAARAGVEAARLAAAGVVGSPVALEGALGTIALFGDDDALPLTEEKVVQLLQDARDAADDLGLKLYPCCRGSHFSIDAALDVRAQLPASARIGDVEVTVPLGSRTALLYDDPQDGLQGKFSLPYTVATSLVRGLPLIEHFEDGAVRDPVVRDVMRRLRVNEDASRGDLSSTMTGRYAVVTVTDDRGRTWSARVDDARGSATRPLTSDEVDEKFLGCVRPVFGDEGAVTLLGRLRTIGSLRSVAGVFPAIAD